MVELKYLKLIVGPMESNCYIVYCPETLNAAIIDPGAEHERIVEAIETHGLHPKLLINTHGHFDHFGANEALLRKYSLKFAIHPEDLMLMQHPFQKEMAFETGYAYSSVPQPEILLEEGTQLNIGKITLTTLHTPGHTPGSICLYAPGYLFTGDTLFAFGIGRTDYPMGDEEALYRSIERLLSFPPETLILPGHGEEITLSECRSNLGI